MSDSKQASINLQKSIKDNSLELQDFIADLHKWEKDIKDQEKQLSPSQDAIPQDLPPVRCRQPETSTQKIVTESRRIEDTEPKKKKERISSYDYAAWDKFDVDEALEEEETSVSQKTLQTQGTTSSSLSKTPVSLHQKERATKLKDEGNKCYSIGRLEDAVAKYTQGMAVDPSNSILPANRAMAYIKLEKYAAAEADCNRCLRLDANYIKAYLRRGTSRLKLQKLKLAAEDFKKVLELEPWNNDAKKELDKLESGVESQTCGSDTKAQKTRQNSSKVKESGQCVPEKKRPEGTSSDPNPEKGDEVSAETRRTDNENRKEQENKNRKEQGSKKKKEKGKRKKIEILEVDSSQNPPKPSVLEDDETLTPVVKMPHQRSQKPLKKVQVVDVLSEDVIPKELPSRSISKVSEVKEAVDSRVKDSPVATKSQRKANVPVQNTQKPSETPQKPSATPSAPTQLPPVPRTSHQFSQDWLRLTPHQPLAIEYLKAIPPSFFRGLDLESEVLVDLVSALRRDDFTSEQAVSYLGALAKSGGFNVNVMFLDNDQKKVFYEVIEKCKDQEQAHSDLLTKLKTSLL